MTSYQCLISDWEHFAAIKWRYIVVDEAHALKNSSSQLQLALRDMRYDSLLLLTGTPLQNDVQELFSLLALIHPEKYSSVGDFVREYGELRGTWDGMGWRMASLGVRDLDGIPPPSASLPVQTQTRCSASSASLVPSCCVARKRYGRAE